MLKSHDYEHKCHAPFQWAPTVQLSIDQTVYSSLTSPLPITPIPKPSLLSIPILSLTIKMFDLFFLQLHFSYFFGYPSIQKYLARKISTSKSSQVVKFVPSPAITLIPGWKTNLSYRWSCMNSPDVWTCLQQNSYNVSKGIVPNHHRMISIKKASLFKITDVCLSVTQTS